MGVIVKYQVDFRETGLRVSNALLAGGLLLDASVSAEMIRGAAGSAFEVKLFDLPEKKATELSKRIQDKSPLHAAIQLGYSDLGPFDAVMEGVVEKVRAVVEEGKLVTIVRGRETATYVLHQGTFEQTFPADTTVKDAMTALVASLKPPKGEQPPTAKVTIDSDAKLPNATVRGANAAVALEELAEIVGAELLIADGKVWIGNPIKTEEGLIPLPKAFSRERNLATLEAFADAIPDENDRNLLNPVKATAAHGFTFLVTGDPKLRPGQKVTADVNGFDLASGGEFRIHSMVHSLTLSEGYTCRGRAVKVVSGPGAKRVERAARLPSADSIINGLSKLTAETRKQRPTVEVGKVKEYSAGSASRARHRANLYYGQKFDPPETQPSVHTAVETKEQQLANEKPVMSPFAWHKCGLVVPVYPGMKAVLAHNQGLDNDAVVAGFVWSETPAIDPPANQAGDWWLCLPSGYDGSAPPSDSTKAANDLTASSGHRVIEVKGLKIVVGASKQRAVGERPTPGSDDEIVIEHSTARISVASSGAIEIVADASAGKGKVTIAPGGDIQLTSGSTTLKVGSSGVEIS